MFFFSHHISILITLTKYSKILAKRHTIPAVVSSGNTRFVDFLFFLEAKPYLLALSL
jgi:hypothetical protein